MFSRPASIPTLLLSILLLLPLGKLGGQEKEADPRVAKLVSEILGTEAVDPPAELLPKEGDQLRRLVAYELLRKRKRLGEAVLTLLSIDEQRFAAGQSNSRSTETVLRSLGPKTRTRITPVLAKWLLSVSKRKRHFAAATLRNLDGLPREAVPNLIRATQSGDEQTRADACLALGWVLPPPKEAEAALRRCLTDLAPGQRYTAASSLLAINRDDVEAMRILIDARVNAVNNRSQASEASMALKKAGPKLVEFSDRWRREQVLWGEIRLFMRGREQQVLPLLTEWLKDKQTPKALRLSIVRALGGLSTVPPMVRDALIEVAIEPTSDDYFTYFTLLPLRKANGFDPDKLAPVIKRNPKTSYIGSFMETLTSCSKDREEQAEAVRSYMLHTHPNVAKAAKESMARLGCDDKEVVEYVRMNLTAPRPQMRGRGAALAHPIAQASGLFLDELFAILDDHGNWKGPTNYVTYINESAVAGLVALGDKAVPGLLKRLESSDAAIRGLAARTLGQMKSEEAVGPLAKILADSNPQLQFWGRFDSALKVRSEALKALANIGGSHTEHLLPEFEKLLENDWSRLDAIHAIGQIGPPSRRLMPRLMEISRGTSNRKTHEALARAITRISPTDSLAVTGLRLVLNQKKQELPNQNWQDLTAFVNSIKLIQSLEPQKAKLLVPHLKELVESEELIYYAIRAYAATALAVHDKDNPRWQAMINRWKSGPWLNDGRVGSYDIESTIWYHLSDLQK